MCGLAKIPRQKQPALAHRGPKLSAQPKASMDGGKKKTTKKAKQKAKQWLVATLPKKEKNILPANQASKETLNKLVSVNVQTPMPGGGNRTRQTLETRRIRSWTCMLLIFASTSFLLSQKECLKSLGDAEPKVLQAAMRDRGEDALVLCIVPDLQALAMKRPAGLAGGGHYGWHDVADAVIAYGGTRCGDSDYVFSFKDMTALTACSVALVAAEPWASWGRVRV